MTQPVGESAAAPDRHGRAAQRRSARRISWALPPVWVRRCVIAPLVVLAAFVWFPFAVWLGILVAGILSVLLPGRARILRVVFIAGVYLLWDALALVWMWLMWVGSGFGWKIHAPVFQRAHYRLAGRMLGSLFTAARWTLRLQINTDEFDLDSMAPGRPIIVVSRHAGPADSFIIVESLINKMRRQPAIVLKDTLQWDPAVDILLNRVPTRFVSPYSRRKEGKPNGVAAVASLAEALDDDDALLIFPEGANATPKRRAKRIDALRAAGHEGLAARAEAMPHVMPPHAGGVLSAMAACPEAAVVMVAHTGLERLSTVRDIWRELPADKSITLKAWLVDAREIPEGRAEREDWLYTWWERIDTWITEHDEHDENDREETRPAN